MARAPANQPPKDQADQSPPEQIVSDAIDLLTRDHQLVDELFASLLQAAPQQLDPLARRLCKMVRIHAQIEEELFYPTARRALGQAGGTEERGMLEEAERDHKEAEEAIKRIESMTSDDSHFLPTIEALRAMIAAHVASEEGELFPAMRRTPVDLVALGITLAERRDTLMDVLGLHGDDEEGAANMRDMLRPPGARTSTLNARR
jgi:hemerythrin superfamily protein